MCGTGTGLGMAIGYIQGRGRGRKTIEQLIAAFNAGAEGLMKCAVTVLMKELNLTKDQAMKRLLDESLAFVIKRVGDAYVNKTE